MELRGKKVLVFGSGLSGVGAADILKKISAKPIIYEGNTSVSREDVLNRIKGDYTPPIYIGELPREIVEQLDLVVMSPGVSLDLPLVKSFYENHIPVWGELELAYRLGKGKVLAITGTNGKTTTTALLGQIMRDYEDSVFVVGNIGTPYTGVSLFMKQDSVTVAEVSSFQLETIDQFRPRVSAILNISEDHLNRHHTMEEYIRVKELITKNQTTGDVCVLNYEDEILRKFGENMREDGPEVLWFSSLRTLEKGIFLKGKEITYREGNQEYIVASTDQLKLLGRHNYENVMAAVAMAYRVGVPMESIHNTICSFAAVEHRIEYVAQKDGVDYYNDSKGTNPDAAIKGIEAMNRPTLLIGGGYDKEADYRPWIQSFRGKVRYLVLIGQTKEKIRQEALECGFQDIIMAEDLKEAVDICASKAQPGDAVLLSPACASWGQFDNYQQRGNAFKEYVHNLS